MVNYHILALREQPGLFTGELAVEGIGCHLIVEREFVGQVVETFGRKAEREAVGHADLRTENDVFRAICQRCRRSSPRGRAGRLVHPRVCGEQVISG